MTRIFSASKRWKKGRFRQNAEPSPSVSINLFREKFHFDLIAVPCSAIAHRGGAEMKFFADFMLFLARYCDIAQTGAAAELWAKGYQFEAISC